MTTGWNRVLVVLFVVGLFAAGAVALPRHLSEIKHRTVELIVDGDSVTEFAVHLGISTEELLSELRQSGVTTVALAEWTVEDAVAAGQVAVVSPQEWRGLPEESRPAWFGVPVGNEPAQGELPTAHPVYVAWSPSRLDQQMADNLAQRLETLGGEPITSESIVVWRVPPQVERGKAVDPSAAVRELGLGFNPTQLKRAQAMGFRVALRPLDSPGFTRHDVLTRIGLLTQPGTSLTIFDGTRIPGEPATRIAWAEGLRATRTPVAWIEFAGQTGLPELIRAVDYAAVRLHSISDPELRGLTRDRAVARWLRAAKERSVRALYLRLYTEAPRGEEDAFTADPLAFNRTYITRLTEALRSAEYRLGEATPFALRSVPSAYILVMASAVGVAGVWLLRRFWQPPLLVEALAVMACAMLPLVFDGYLGRQLIALGAAVLMPTIATLASVEWVSRSGYLRPVVAAVSALLIATAISLCGAALVVGLLSETPFALGVRLFVGVKAMHILPPVIVAFMVLWDRPVTRARSLFRRLRDVLSTPISLGSVLVLGVLAALALLVVLRTGNDLLPVSGLEQALREGLERVLGVRPRNKEFLLGHPAFLLSVFLIAKQGLPPLARSLLLAVASVGQLSLVNTFAHIHTPLGISFVRTLYGLALGIVIGLLWIGIAKIVRRVFGRHTEAGSEEPCV